jgi:hypothetical protein
VLTIARPNARPIASPTVRARAVLVPYVISRVVVIAALATARQIFTTLQLQQPGSLHDGLRGWDAAWYIGIARGGYAGVAREGLRFFPLFPALGRGVSLLPGVDAALGVLIVANVSALLLGFVVYELARRERDDALARRAVWLLYLLPPAYVLVMGYAEATFMLLSTIVLFGARERRWWIAAAAGLLAGLTRPIGALLTIPVAIEAWRQRKASAFVAACAPAVGALAYLAWAARRSHEFLYPLRVQEDASRRGGWVDPVRALAHNTSELFHGDHLSAGMHVVSAIVLIALLVVLARRWPLSYTLYAGAVLFVALTSRNLDSLERYALSAVPFVFAAADVLNTEERQFVVYTVAGACLVGGSILVFTGILVP